MSGTGIPRRHHFIPQLILRNFANERGNLYFWRRTFATGDVREAVPDNLFVEKDLYSITNSDGEIDVSVELYFSRMEGPGAQLIAQLLEIVRSGGLPKLDDNAWGFWHWFFYFLMKRPPAYIRRIAEGVSDDEFVDVIVEDFKAKGHELSPELKRQLSDPDFIAEIKRESMPLAQAKAPSDELKAAFKSRGMAIYRIADPKKSFVVGELAMAMARIDMNVRNPVGGRLSFMPLAHDVAVGFHSNPKTVQVFEVSTEQIRRMNVATTAKSNVIAGKSAALIASLARKVPYDRRMLTAEFREDLRPLGPLDVGDARL